MKKCLGAPLAGAIVAFIWASISWMVLPWHNLDMKSFKDDGVAITQAIQHEATESGIYTIPNMTKDLHENKEKSKEWAEKAQKGPFAYLAVDLKGTKWDMRMGLMVQFIILLIVAFVGSWIINKSSMQGVFKNAIFLSFAVTAGAFLVHASNWNWWGFPVMTTVVNFVDPAIAWFLAGLVMAKIIK
ncbi:MAG: hypothetical protein ACHQJ6_04880 [Candidatus Berkiellales bacterium]